MGQDKIPISIFKNCSQSIKKSLRQLFYDVKQTSSYPELWKKAPISPSYKKGDKPVAENYRPVSLLPIISKTLSNVSVKTFILFLNLKPRKINMDLQKENHAYFKRLTIFKKFMTQSTMENI